MSLAQDPVGVIGLVLLVTTLIVGLALGAAALIGLAKRHGVLGIFAANHLTELVWGATAMLLIAFSRLPRVGHDASQRDHQGRASRPRARGRADRQPSRPAAAVGLNQPCGPSTVSSRGTDSNFLHPSTKQAQEQIQWLTST